MGAGDTVDITRAEGSGNHGHPRRHGRGAFSSEAERRAGRDEVFEETKALAVSKVRLTNEVLQFPQTDSVTQAAGTRIAAVAGRRGNPHSRAFLRLTHVAKMPV